ncbi:MAG: hypothetical protein ACRCX8_12820 [Sarcina sp.]
MANFKEEKIEKVCRHWPTGYSIIDIMAGENFRDLHGNLTDMIRGFELTGKQYAIAAQQGAGKSTAIADFTSFPLHIGMDDCIHKIIIIDTDNAAWNKHRIRKLTNLDFETIENKYKIIQTQSIEEIVSEIKKESAEYAKMKYRPVKFYDPYMQMERTMMPSVLIVFDTVTSISSDAYEEKDVLAKQQGLTTFLDIANLSNNIGSFFGGNNATLWMAHLKENKAPIGQTVADKEFKAAPAKWKSHIPKRIAQKLSSFFWFTKTQDMENQESPNHPIQIYGLQDLKTKSVFVTNAITVKSRTGTEGRTVAKMFFIDGKFDKMMTMLATCLDLGVLKEGSGMHPSAENPSIFKNQPGCEEEYQAQGRRSKKVLTLAGYDRPTNIIEARLLLNYLGDNEEIMNAKAEFMTALQEQMEEVLYYELETNNVTAEEFQTNKDKIKSLLGFITATKRVRKNVTQEDIDESTPESRAKEFEADIKI